MKQSKFYVPTLKEVPSIAEIKSHQLLLKAGYIHQTAAGIYTYLPMATKILKNIENIIREELDKIGANEVIMPFLEPADLWEQSGRWNSYGDELFRIKDRHEREFALAPTHEEVATELVKNYLNSYKKLPLNLYQIQTKMRDERRPRFGLLRGREFIMMDGYTFDVDDEKLKESYDAYYKAYKIIFERLGLDYKIVMADNGSMGGAYSHEFMAISDVGEDFIAYEDKSDTAYNLEIAPIYTKYEMDNEEPKEQDEISTPNVTTIKQLVEEYKFPITKLTKAVAYNVDGNLVIAFVVGDKEVEDVKVANLCHAQNEIEPASEELLKENNIIPGFIGINNLPNDVKILVDKELKYKRNLVTGANKKDTHLINVNISQDLEFVDIRKACEGDLISENGEPIKIAKGIEVGHIFALGKRYTESLDVKFLNKEQKNEIPTMGSYGIGVSRLLATIVEQHSDDNGIVLPKNISPFHVHVIPLDYHKNEDQREFTDKIISQLDDNGIKYLLDDRDQRPGIKFNDSDLIGIPYQIIIGKRFIEDVVEFKTRKNNEKSEISSKDILSKIK